jgi:hypothetical protein
MLMICIYFSEDMKIRIFHFDLSKFINNFKKYNSLL